MDAQFFESRQRGRDRAPRRADALHPHLDSSPENPNDFWGSDDTSSPDQFDVGQYPDLLGEENGHPAQEDEEQEEQEQESSDDSEGTYATPQWPDETPTFEEDLTWEQEDLEEEAREGDEVTSVSPENEPYPPVTRVPPWLLLDGGGDRRTTSAADRAAAAAATPHRPNPMLGRSWLWGQDDDHEMHPDDPTNQIMGKGRLSTRLLMPDQWTDRVACKAMPKPWFGQHKGKGAGKSREGRASGSGTASIGGGTSSMTSQSEETADHEHQQPTVEEPEPEQL
eukprot:3304223-Amphidinium_carterae.1